jgi:ATP-binding cassette subfamily C protein CydD
MPDTARTVHSRLLAYSRSARRFLSLTIALGVIAALIVVAQAWVLGAIIGRVFIEGQGLSEVRNLLIALLALSVTRFAVVWSGDVVAQRSASHLKSRLRADLAQHILTLGPEFISGERSGELTNTVVGGVEDLDEYITSYQPLRFLAVLVPIIIALSVLVIDPPTVLILLVTGPLVVLFLALIGSRARAVTQRRFVELSWMSASFLDILQGIATLKMFGRSREQIRTIRDVSQRYGTATMKVLRTAFETAFVLEMCTTIATALVAVEISLRLMDGGLPFQRALTVLILTPEFFQPLRQLSVRYHAGTAGSAAAERIFAILDTPTGETEAGPRSITRAKPLTFDIRFESVSYAYDDGQRPALNGLSLCIPHGQTVALVGATGAVKTTVAKLLLRFIEPDSGSITAGEMPLSSLDPVAWRSQVAWVPQRPHLFYGTVEENIRLADPHATHEAVVAAATAAHAHGFIEALPNGYGTLIGERGARLSGGEKQRLAIARAFLKDAPFLVLDEATSHLDSESEAMIRDAIERLLNGRTALIIAHRLKLVCAADAVVVMDKGRVIESDAPQTLLDQIDQYETSRT